MTPESLATESCHEVPPGTPPLTDAQARELAQRVSPDWRIGSKEIQREFRLADFNAAFALATRVALLAEAQQHHPDMEVGWGRVLVRFATHSVGGLSRNDFIMAARVDAIADSGTR